MVRGRTVVLFYLVTDLIEVCLLLGTTGLENVLFEPWVLMVGGVCGKRWGTCWAGGTIEASDLVEIVVFFGGFGSHCEILIFSVIDFDDVIVMVLAGAVVHIPDGGQHLFFH